MSNESDSRYLTDAGMAFFGAVTASVSHELNNVISIIDQTAGLLDDMIAGEEQGVPLSVERLTTAVASVQKQTERGLEIIKRLNKFAHSTDQPLLEFEVNEVLDNFVALARRLASLKRADLVLSPPVEQLKITSNPFFLQQVVFRTFKLVLEEIQPGDVVRLGAVAVDNGVAIKLESPRPVMTADDKMAEFNRLAMQIEGKLTAEPLDSGTRFTLTIPLRPAN
ncbi:MAG: hypothetical protein ABIJ61_10975 [bacterium]